MLAFRPITQGLKAMNAQLQGAADVGTPLGEHVDTLDILERAAREFYLEAERAGVTHAQMSEATGLPSSLFSMWLRGYRGLKKLEVLQKLVEGAPAVETLSLLA
jgi:hypothetical protein